MVNFLSDERAQSMTEYILMIFLLVLSCAQVVKTFGLVLDIALLQAARKLGAAGGTIK